MELGEYIYSFVIKIFHTKSTIMDSVYLTILWNSNYTTTLQTLTSEFLQHFSLARDYGSRVILCFSQTLQFLHFNTFATSFNVFFTNITNSKKASFHFIQNRLARQRLIGLQTIIEETIRKMTTLFCIHCSNTVSQCVRHCQSLMSTFVG